MLQESLNEISSRFAFSLEQSEADLVRQVHEMVAKSEEKLKSENDTLRKRLQKLESRPMTMMRSQVLAPYFKSPTCDDYKDLFPIINKLVGAD